MGSSQFEFFKNHHVPSLTVLKAAIEDFSYDRHAHEEYAFGVTLAGRQDFFSGGQFHRSPPGNVILFNPEEVHDGHAGGEQALGYVMVYVHPNQVLPLFEELLGRPPNVTVSLPEYADSRPAAAPGDTGNRTPDHASSGQLHRPGKTRCIA